MACGPAIGRRQNSLTGRRRCIRNGQSERCRYKKTQTRKSNHTHPQPFTTAQAQPQAISVDIILATHTDRHQKHAVAEALERIS